MRHTTIVTVLVAALLVVTAGAAGAKAKPTAADKVLLRAGIVTEADVPAGWTATSQADGSADEFKGVKGCRTLYATVRTASAKVPYRLSKVYSPPGADNGLTVVDDTVLSFRTPAAAGRFLAAFQASGTGPCLHAVLAKSLRGEGHATVAPLASLGPIGDASAGYEVSITSSSPGLTGPQVGDIVVGRVGRVVAYVSTLNAAAAPLPELPGVVRAVVGRLRQARA